MIKDKFKTVCDNGGFSEAIVRESKKGNLEQALDESVLIIETSFETYWAIGWQKSNDNTFINK